MRYIVFSCVIAISIILYIGNCKEDEKEKLPDNVLSEKIIEHRYLYQNGRVIEMTKKIVKMKRKENDNKNTRTN
jgi:hypothetical protein